VETAGEKPSLNKIKGQKAVTIMRFRQYIYSPTTRQQVAINHISKEANIRIKFFTGVEYGLTIKINIIQA
jgi:hypothetical protein